MSDDKNGWWDTEQECSGSAEATLLSVFKNLSKTCPWRSYLKCKVLHSAGEFGSDGCKIDNCAPMHLRGLLSR